MKFKKALLISLLSFAVVGNVYAKTITAQQAETAQKQFERGEYKKAFPVMQELAKQGHAVAQYQLGYVYVAGKLGKKDLPNGIKWFTKAAEQGDDGAKIALAWLYFNEDTIKDWNKAEKWLEATSAKSKQNVIVQNQLAMLYAFQSATKELDLDDNAPYANKSIYWLKQLFSNPNKKSDPKLGQDAFELLGVRCYAQATKYARENNLGDNDNVIESLKGKFKTCQAVDELQRLR